MALNLYEDRINTGCIRAIANETRAGFTDRLLACLPQELHSKQIAIIGAGLAGLTVAHTLSKSCVSTSLFEAAERLGGRAFTDTIDGKLIERGAELINANHISIQKLIEEFGLTLENLYQPSQERIRLGFSVNTSRYNHEQFVEALAPLQKLMKFDIDLFGGVRQAQVAIRNVNLNKYVDNSEAKSWVKDAVKLLFSTEYGRDCSEISAESLFYEELHNLTSNTADLFAKGYGQFRIKEGTSALAYEMSASLPPINCGHKLVKISSDGAQHSLTFDVGGNTVIKKFDIVVITVPFPALRGVDLSECDLSENRKNAIKSLKYGSTSKTFILAQSESDGRNNTETLDDQLGGAVWNSTRNSANKSTIMTLYTRDTEREVDNATIGKVIERDHGGKEARVIERSSWQNNTLAGGSYSINNEHIPVDGIKTTEKHGELYFAGEHTLVHASYMNSAIRSGLAVANRILRYLFSLVPPTERN